MSLFTKPTLFSDWEDFARLVLKQLSRTFAEIEEVELPKIHGPYDDEWIDGTLEGTWIALGQGYPTAQYRKQGHFIYLRGLIATGGVFSNPIMTLPVGYRPLALCLHATVAADLLSQIRITTLGVVEQATIGSAIWVSLDGIVFSIE